MAERFWVGGTSTWDGTAGTKWALTDGGAGGQAVPTSADSVHFTAASGAGTATISATANCANLDLTGYTGTIAGSSALNVFGNFIGVATATWSYTGTLTLKSTAYQTVTSNGLTFGGAVTFSGAGGTWALQDNFTNVATATTTLNLGTLDLNNHNMTTGLFNADAGTNVRACHSGTGQFFVTGTSTAGSLSVWLSNTTTGLTWLDRPTLSATGASTGTNTRFIATGIVAEAVAPNVNITAGSDKISLSASACENSVNFTGFTGTWLNNLATIFGSLTLSPTMTFGAGANTTTFAGSNNAQAINLAGQTIPWPLAFTKVATAITKFLLGLGV